MVTVESLDHEGRGVARRDGKVIFIEGALAGEQVTFSSFRRKPAFEIANVAEVLRASPYRVVPRCPHFGTCGGCSLQHLEVRAQVAVKQRILEDNLERIGKVRPDAILPAIQGPAWGYRHRARFTVRYVAKKGGVLVGFHEKKSSFVADMRSCEVVPPRISRLIVPLRELIGSLSRRDRIPQIELAVGDATDILVVRVLEPLTENDKALLRTFADAYGVQLYLQPKGPESVEPFHPLPARPLYYTLPEFGLRLEFEPIDFTQVNHAVNTVLVRRALRLLDPQPGERVADMFCGLGNFALAIARRGATVIGIEGSAALVARAAHNTARNGLAGSAAFQVANLFAMTPQTLSAFGRFDGMLIDPPRDGAMELVKSLGADSPRRIVYVSCNPATLARDAAVLVHAQGYGLAAAGVANMFPHTSHVESVALFVRS